MSEVKGTPEQSQVDEATEVAEVVEPVVETVEEVKVTEEVVEETPAVEEAPVEEVVEEVKEVVPSMDEFQAEIDASLTRVDGGDIVDCKIITLNDEEVIVNLGYLADGLITKEELLLEPGQTIADAYVVGQELKAEVLTMNDGEGNVLLSEKKAVQVIVWDELEVHFKEQTTLTVTLSEVVKGGLIAMIKGIRAFMPASMVAARYVEDLNEFVGKELKVHVKDFDRQDRKVIISHKEIDRKLREEAKKNFFVDVKKDQEFSGTVKKLMNFGAFVDLGGVDGLVHINEMSWKRIKHPSDVMKEGDVVDVYIIDVDREKEKISLGLKNIGDNPWDTIFDTFTIGQVYEGEVVRLANFGAFVRIGDGIEGLVHISEISHDRIGSPADVLTQGQKVNVKILNIEKSSQKISLSIKETTEDENAVELEKYTTDEKATTSLESVFKDILKDLK